MLNIAVVGNGAWGINLVRNFSELEKARLYACCDLDEKKLARIKRTYPGTKTTQRFDDILADSKVDAVVIAAPAVFHYRLAKEALNHNKHIYIEKPFVLSVEEAEELVQLSDEKRLTLMIGHLMEYHPAVNKLKELVSSGELGDVYYLYSQRVNLGIIRKDENALWSFAPHDISMILYLLDEEPIDVSARGESYLQDGIQDVVFVNLRFPGKKMANIQLSWLDPHKIRKLTVVGSKKMVVFDDVESVEKVKIYDKGVKHRSEAVSYSESFTLRFGDITIPNIQITEPLKLECQHFIDCITNDKAPRSDGRDGLRVVRVLQTAQKSLDKDGVPVRI